MIIEGDENTGSKDIHIPDFLEPYVGLLFKFNGWCHPEEAEFISILSNKEKLEPCRAYVQVCYLPLDATWQTICLVRLLSFPGTRFEVLKKYTYTWLREED